MRTAAELVELGGEHAEAQQLRQEADELVQLVMELYIPGSGHFHARQPDGTLAPTRHCYDFATVGTTIAGDLDEDVRAEMVRFFTEELQTPSWMRALSPYDPDAGFSLRADHQWNGAYPAWPPDAARAVIALGRPDVVAQWLPGLARTANQGPPGQAHFVEEAAETINGGARKTPPQAPYLIDWSCSSAGSWVELVLSGIFGVHVDAAGEIRANPQLADFDPDAVLHGMRVRGATYKISGRGVSRRG